MVHARFFHQGAEQIPLMQPLLCEFHFTAAVPLQVPDPQERRRALCQVGFVKRLALRPKKVKEKQGTCAAPCKKIDRYLFSTGCKKLVLMQHQ